MPAKGQLRPTGCKAQCQCTAPVLWGSSRRSLRGGKLCSENVEPQNQPFPGLHRALAQGFIPLASHILGPGAAGPKVLSPRAGGSQTSVWLHNAAPEDRWKRGSGFSPDNLTSVTHLHFPLRSKGEGVLCPSGSGRAEHTQETQVRSFSSQQAPHGVTSPNQKQKLSLDLGMKGSTG